MPYKLYGLAIGSAGWRASEDEDDRESLGVMSGTMTRMRTKTNLNRFWTSEDEDRSCGGLLISISNNTTSFVKKSLSSQSGKFSKIPSNLCISIG